MKITLEQLTTPIGDYMPYVELLRAIGVYVGEPKSKRYKNWILNHDNKSHFDISNPKFSDQYFSLFDENGDIDCYRKYQVNEETDLITTDNQANLFRMYKALGIKVPYSHTDKTMIKNIKHAKKNTGK